MASSDWRWYEALGNAREVEDNGGNFGYVEGSVQGFAALAGWCLLCRWLRPIGFRGLD